MILVFYRIEPYSNLNYFKFKRCYNLINNYEIQIILKRNN